MSNLQIDHGERKVRASGHAVPCFSCPAHHSYSYWAHGDKAGFLLTLKLALAQRIHHVWNWTAADKFSPFWSRSCSRRQKNKKGSIEQRAENRQRRPTMQPFIKTRSAFKLDAVNAHLQGCSALSRLGSNTTLISTNTRESVSDWRSVEYIWNATVTTVLISCHNTEQRSDFKPRLKTNVKKPHFRPSGFCAAASSLLWADKNETRLMDSGKPVTQMK